MTSFLLLKQKKNGDVVVVIDPSALLSVPKKVVTRLLVWLTNTLVSFFVQLNRLAFNHGLLAIISALGLGFGIGITVFQTPSSVVATSDQIYSQTRQFQTADVVLLKIPDLKREVVVKVGQEPVVSFGAEAAWQTINLSPSIAGTTTLFGEYNNQVFKGIENLKLGSQLKVLKANNGWYTYQVVETRQIDREELDDVQFQNQPALILYTHKQLNKNQLFVIVAR